jgi:hypothetical protein
MMESMKMSQDYPVEARSDAHIRAIAKRVRSSFAVIEHGRVDLLATLHKRKLYTECGEKRLNFERRPDKELDGDDGMTVFVEGSVTIILSETSYRLLRFGVARRRNTAAHELGHAVLHQGAPMRRGYQTSVNSSWIPPFKSSEHQAKIFAPALLIDDEIAASCENDEEISVKFGVSLESASIYMRDVRKSDQRNRMAQKLREASELLTSEDNNKSEMRFLPHNCPNCGPAKLFPVGVKYMCQKCDNVYDRFQDGDTIGF